MSSMNFIGSPIAIGELVLKNRLLMPAMHTLYTQDGLPTERFSAFYEARAEGGAGLLVVGACRFDGKGAKASCMSLTEDACVEPWRGFTDRIHAKGCPVAVQLYHAGRYMRHEEVPDGGDAIGPSAVFTPFTRQTAREATREELSAIREAFAAGALRAKQAGFDAVELSASAGYLLCQFLSPLSNVRADEYGGSEENRMRFPLEVIAAVRAAVGPSYPVLLRCGSHTFVPGAGGSEDSLRFAAAAAEAGVDLLDMTGGWHESRTPQLTQDAPEGFLLPLAARLRRLAGIPVAVANRMDDPRRAEQAIALGQCDMIALGRPLVAAPDLPRQWLAATPERARPCMACNEGCLAGTFFEKPIRCLSNPEAGREHLRAASPAPVSKRVLVVGAGPAGMECALQTARRGHRVTLLDRAERPGGMLRLAMRLPARGRFARLIDWYERALREAGVELRFGCEASAETIRAGEYDECVLACGRRYKPVSVPMEPDAVPVYTPEQLLAPEPEDRPVLPARVAVIGGSFVGLETARLLLAEGAVDDATLLHYFRYHVESADTVRAMLSSSGRTVAVFERGKLRAGYEPGVAWPVTDDLARLGCELHDRTEVLRVTGKGVETGEGLWPCDAVVFCPGTEPEEALLSSLETLLPTRRIGNAARLCRAIDAIEEGFFTGCEL